MRIGTIVLFIIVFMAMASVGAILKQSDIENNIERDIINLTENTFVWNYTSNLNCGVVINESMDVSEIQGVRINNIIYKLVDSVGYILIEIAKWSVEFGYENPEFNFIFWAKTLAWLLVLSIISPLIIPIIILMYMLAKYIIRKVREAQHNAN